MSRRKPPNRLISLFHRRWSVPVITELARDGGSKFVTLVNRLGVGRETLRATLDDLVELGLVQRNPGHGHPMRPEYFLTAEGARLAPPSSRLLATVRRLGIEGLAFRKWTLPLSYVMDEETWRFSELRGELPGITPRALTLSLKDMQEHDLVRREVYDDYPPTTSYRLHRRARPLLETLGPLAQVA